MDIVILDTCKKELKDFSENIISDFLDALAKLKNGVNLSMPLSRKMEGLEGNVHELRLKDSSGIYRVIYLIIKKDAIYIVHAFKKKTNKTPKKNLDLVRKRIRRLL
ncbi:MAG: type II toxin-antitoxin system RelE/ParE family toxin [Bacteriovoracaceae bacterium]|nr:type II toxin-antitoxin system RelE/ParE family toxin [Bacteriovoracaceae bacterium]